MRFRERSIAQDLDRRSQLLLLLFVVVAAATAAADQVHFAPIWRYCEYTGAAARAAAASDCGGLVPARSPVYVSAGADCDFTLFKVCKVAGENRTIDD